MYFLLLLTSVEKMPGLFTPLKFQQTFARTGVTERRIAEKENRSYTPKNMSCNLTQATEISFVRLSP
jgi:hypothetical protein